MGHPALRIKVTTKDQNELSRLLSGGVQPVRIVMRAMALLPFAQGVSAPHIAGVVPLTVQAIRKIGPRYRPQGLAGAL
jgi:putative transposase